MNFNYPNMKQISKNKAENGLYYRPKDAVIITSITKYDAKLVYVIHSFDATNRTYKLKKMNGDILEMNFEQSDIYYFEDPTKFNKYKDMITYMKRFTMFNNFFASLPKEVRVTCKKLNHSNWNLQGTADNMGITINKIHSNLKVVRENIKN